MMDIQQIEKACRQAAGYGVEVRRHLHCHPELSGLEFATVRYIQAQLTALGIPWTDIPDGGVLGVLEGAAEGRSVLLRADCDALTQETGMPVPPHQTEPG